VLTAPCALITIVVMKSCGEEPKRVELKTSQ
jgi:hypothetical protein